MHKIYYKLKGFDMFVFDSTGEQFQPGFITPEFFDLDIENGLFNYSILVQLRLKSIGDGSDHMPSFSLE